MAPTDKTAFGGKNREGVGRRSFLKWGMGILGGSALLAWGLSHFKRKVFAIPPAYAKTFQENRRKLTFIAIDALHPNYLDLDANGFPGGSDGNWLMPHVRSFLKSAVCYRNAKAYLPAATDMNHLNALAGTSAALTGILGVWAQPISWDGKGRMVIKHTHLSYARDDKGRAVDTLFHAWKRRWPDSKTLLISGKEWVGEMFRMDGPDSVVDILVTGPNHPSYLEPPRRESFVDPPADTDAACDPESKRLGFFGWKMRPSDIMTRLYTGQRSLLTLQMEHFPDHFPHDRWIVDSTLDIFKREDPDLAYILLAQCDDAGRCIGSAADPSEFENAEKPYQAPKGCENKPGYQLVSRRNRLLFREAILDGIRDVDIQFGRLIKGLEEQGVLGRASMILLSDHSAVNHISCEDFSYTDVVRLLKDAGMTEHENVYAFSVSCYGALYWRDEKEMIPRARGLLEAHKAHNPETGTWECPWWVLDRKDMKNGVEGVCLPGELYHHYYVEVDREKTVVWPDLFILTKNGWQIPVYNGHVPDVGIPTAKWLPPWRIYNGGHGSVDTLPIVAANIGAGRQERCI